MPSPLPTPAPAPTAPSPSPTPAPAPTAPSPSPTPAPAPTAPSPSPTPAPAPTAPSPSPTPAPAPTAPSPSSTPAPAPKEIQAKKAAKDISNLKSEFENIFQELPSPALGSVDAIKNLSPEKQLQAIQKIKELAEKTKKMKQELNKAFTKRTGLKDAKGNDVTGEEKIKIFREILAGLLKPRMEATNKKIGQIIQEIKNNK